MSVTIWYSVGCRNRYRPKGLVSSLAVRVTRTTPPRDHWLGEGAAVASPVCSVVTSTFLDLHRNFGGLSIEVVWSQILAIPNPGAGNPPSLLTFISTVEPSPRAKAAPWRRRFKIAAVTVSLLLLLGLVLFVENGLSYLITSRKPMLSSPTYASYAVCTVFTYASAYAACFLQVPSFEPKNNQGRGWGSVANWCLQTSTEGRELLRVAVVAKGIQPVKFRAEFLEQIDGDIRADLDISPPDSLQQGRLTSEIARGIRHIGNDGPAVSAGKLWDVNDLVTVVLISEETHLQCVPRALKAAFATAIDVSRVRMHQRGAALMNSLLTAELGEIGSNALSVACEAGAPLPGLVVDLLPVGPAEDADVGEGGEEGIVPKVVPTALPGKWHVAIRGG
jgi:hypothetical protein